MLDPVACIGAEACAHGRVESLDRPQQTEVPFLDQVLKRQSLADVAPGDVDDQSQVRPHHPLARQLVPIGDPVGQLLLFVGGQQSHFVDLPEVSLQGALHRVTAMSANTGHEESSLSRSKLGPLTSVGFEQEQPCQPADRQRCGVDPDPGAPVVSHRQTSSSAERLRSRSSPLNGHVTFPGKVSASQPKLSPFAAPRLPRMHSPGLRRAVNRPKGRIELGQKPRADAGQDPILLFNSLRRSRSHTTKYRTIPLIT